MPDLIQNYTYMLLEKKEPAKEYKTLKGLLTGARRKVRTPDATYRLLIDGKAVSKGDLDKVLTRLKEELKKKRLGVDYKVQALANGAAVKPVAQVRVRVAGKKLAPADTQGVEGIDNVVAYVDFLFKNRRYAGICVCKPNSDHRDCAAVDWFDSLENMRRAKDFFLQPEVMEHINLKYLILENRIYFRDGSNRLYGGVFHSHVHLSVYGGIFGGAC